VDKPRPARFARRHRLDRMEKAPGEIFDIRTTTLPGAAPMLPVIDV
jgi:hypothetical protein